VPVIPVDKVVNRKRIIIKRRAEEEERHKGSLTKKTTTKRCSIYMARVLFKVEENICVFNHTR
jgi:hypothetical protein